MCSVIAVVSISVVFTLIVVALLDLVMGETK